MRYLISSFVFLLTIATYASSIQESIRASHEHIYTLLKSQPDLAYQLSLEAEQNAQSAGLKFEEANSIYIQAWLLKSNMHEPGKSFVLYLKALELIKPIHSETEELTNLYIDLLENTGNILKEHYAYTEALKYYDEALIVSRQQDLLKGICSSLRLKAIALNEAGQTEQALSIMKSASTYAQQLNDAKTTLSVNNTKGLIEIDNKLYESARVTFEKIVSFNFDNEKLKTKYIGMAWHNIGHSYSEEGNQSAAIQAFKKAEKIKIQSTSKKSWFITQKDISEAYFKMGNFEMSESYAFKALENYDKAELKRANYEIYERLASIYFSQGDYVKSREYTEKFIIENDKFIVQQEEIQKNKDRYKMEILTAGFFTESNSKKSESIYSLLLSFTSILLTVTIAGGVLWQYHSKRNIKKALLDIEKSSLF
jgi:tetratricopeptide (TPR) repeat protein